MSESPYELLARFNANGTIAGVHVRNLLNVNGKTIEGDPIPLADATDPAFTQFAEAFAAQVVSERDALQTELTTLQAERDEAVGVKESLEARIAELELLLNPPGPDTSTAEGLKQYLANVRYEHEVSGFNVGDQFISTNRDELAHWLARFLNAFNWLQGDTSTNPSGLYPYKPRGGSVVAMLTAQQAVRSYQCITWYVNACIATEGQLIEAIDAGGDLVAIKAMIDNAATWPQRQFDWVPPS